MKTLIVIFICISAPTVFAQSLGSFMSSSKIKVFNKRPLTGSFTRMPFDVIGGAPIYDPALNTITPKGDHWSTPSPKCSNESLSKLIHSQYSSNRDMADTVGQWSSDCNNQLNTFDLINTVFRFHAVNYQLDENPEVLEVEFTLRNGEKLNGVLGIKDITSSRPLIISKCGLYCDTGLSATSKDTFMHLFDESPFNLLLLSSTTGAKYSTANHTSPFGGFIEGEQIIQTAKLLLADDSNFKNLISDIHLHGFSLGGNAALMAALYASFNPQLPIRSAVATCPVVNLKRQMKSLFNTRVQGAVGRVQTLDQLKLVYDELPGIQKYLSQKKFGKWSQDELYFAISEASFDYYKNETRISAWPTPPFNGTVVQFKDQLWDLNEFQNYIEHIKIPTTVVYASDDFLVTNKYNVNPLRKALAANPNSNIGLIDVKNGNHCAFSMGIGWDVYSTLISSLYSKYSAEFKFDHYFEHSIPLSLQGGWDSLNSSTRLRSNETIVKSTWEIKTIRNYANLIITVFDKNKYRKNPRGKKIFKCSRSSLYSAPKHCYRKYKIRVSMESLQTINIRPAESTFQANRMTRWLNTNTHLTGPHFEDVLGSRELPSNLHFKNTYFFN